MKKLLLVMIAFVTAALIAGCSNVANDKNDNTNTTKAQETVADAQEETTAAQTINAADSILEKDADGNYIKPSNMGAVIKLGNYKGLKVTLDKSEVTEDEIETEIKNVHAADPDVPSADRQKDPDDAWVEKYTGGEYKTIKDFKEFIRARLQANKDATAEAQAQNELVTKVLEDSEITVAQEAIEYYYQTTIAEYQKAADASGMKLDEYINKSGYDPAALKMQISYYAEESVKQQLMSDAVMKAEGMTLEDADYKVLADIYGYDVDTMKKLYGEEEFEDFAKSYKVVQFIYDNAEKN